MSIETGYPSPEDMGVTAEQPREEVSGDQSNDGVAAQMEETHARLNPADLSEQKPAIENNEPYEPMIPNGWTFLKHGTSLDRWGDVNPYTTDSITMKRPLSAISKEMFEHDQRHGPQYNTTATYAGQQRPFEIRVLFYKEPVRGSTGKEYPTPPDPATLDRIETYYYRNIQGGRHPLVPKGEVLRKLGQVVEEGRDVFYFVPESIADQYFKEVELQQSHG